MTEAVIEGQERITIGALTIVRVRERLPGQAFSITSDFCFLLNGRPLSETGLVSDIVVHFPSDRAGIVKTVLTIDGPAALDLTRTMVSEPIAGAEHGCPDGQIITREVVL